MAPGALRGVYVTVIGSHPTKGWHTEELTRWTTAAKGHYLSNRFTDETTHVVLSQRDWSRQPNIVQQALEAKDFQGRKIRFVSWDWLTDCLTEQKKKNETPYDWLKLDAAAAKQQQKTKARREEAKTTQGMMGELFTAETDKYITDAERKQFEKEAAAERRAQREQEEDQKRARKEAAKMNRQELTAMFKQGAKRARNEIFSENHHVYIDRTGFKYDVTLTKTLTRQNKNERLVLTLYESNAEPHTYAMNAHSAATGRRPDNTIIVAIGMNFETTFRRFQKVFQENTGVKWDERINFARERARQAKAKREHRMAEGADVEDGSVGLGSGRGAVNSDGEQRPGLSKRKTEEEMARDRAEDEKQFKLAKFLYYPPSYGPVGVLPGNMENNDFDAAGRAAPAETSIGKAMHRTKKNDVLRWMTSADNAMRRPEPKNSGIATSEPSNGALTRNKVDTLDMSRPFGLDNEAGEDAVTEFDFGGLTGRESTIGLGDPTQPGATQAAREAAIQLDPFMVPRSRIGSVFRSMTPFVPQPLSRNTTPFLYPSIGHNVMPDDPNPKAKVQLSTKQNGPFIEDAQDDTSIFGDGSSYALEKGGKRADADSVPRTSRLEEIEIDAVVGDADADVGAELDEEEAVEVA